MVEVEGNGCVLCPPICFIAQHSLDGHGVLRWPSPSGRRKKGSREVPTPSPLWTGLCGPRVAG